MIEIYQKTDNYFPIALKDGYGELVQIDGLEVCIGNIVKRYPGDIEIVDGEYIVTLSQADTWDMLPCRHKLFVRGRDGDNVEVIATEEVLVRPCQGGEIL